MNLLNMQTGSLGGRISSYSLRPTQNSKFAKNQNNRSDLLTKFREQENEDDIFGNVEEAHFNDIEQDFKTLKISSEGLETLRLSRNKSIKFGNEFTPQNHLHINHKSKSAESKDFDLDLKLSPGETISSSSPKTPFGRRMGQKSLEKYSEDDTDVTSQFDEDEFEGIEDIFGNQEDISYAKINNQLVNKRKQLERDAEMEERELKQLFNKQQLNNNQQNDSMRTLKLKDFNYYNSMAKPGELLLEGDVTVNYDYTKDDFETFEEGFEDLQNIFKSRPSKKIYPASLNSKISMPNLYNKTGKYVQDDNVATVRHFKSTMDLSGNKQEKLSKHPKFNNENKIIKKLDRIPSFYNSGNNSQKQALLDKYKESNRYNTQRKNSILQQSPARHKKVSLVRCLNSSPIVDRNSKMKFNSQSKIWEGNEIDLARFDNVNKITINDIKDLKKNLNSNGNMKFDEDNLKWVNLEEDNEEYFKNIPDLVDSPKPIRGISSFTQRTTSTASASTSTSDSADDNLFTIPSKLADKFYKEELKIRKKTENWFGVNQNYSIDRNLSLNRDYFWEIRKMVMDTRD